MIRKRKVVAIIIIVVIGCLLSLFVKKDIPSAIINTIYTVMGIMFSVGTGLIVTFNLQGVKNKSILRTFRDNLKLVRNRFIFNFIFVTIVYVLYQLFDKIITFDIKTTQISINPSIICTYILIISIIYFVVNFISIQNLSEEVFDEVNK